MSLIPGILVKAPRTEAAQPPQNIFGTFKLTSVRASPRSLGTFSFGDWLRPAAATGVAEPVADAADGLGAGEQPGATNPAISNGKASFFIWRLSVGMFSGNDTDCDKSVGAKSWA